MGHSGSRSVAFGMRSSASFLVVTPLPLRVARLDLGAEVLVQARDPLTTDGASGQIVVWMKGRSSLRERCCRRCRQEVRSSGAAEAVRHP